MIQTTTLKPMLSAIQAKARIVRHYDFGLRLFQMRVQLAAGHQRFILQWFVALQFRAEACGR